MYVFNTWILLKSHVLNSGMSKLINTIITLLWPVWHSDCVYRDLFIYYLWNLPVSLSIKTVLSGSVVCSVKTLSVQVYRSQSHGAHLTDLFDLVITMGCEEWCWDCEEDESGLSPNTIPFIFKHVVSHKMHTQEKSHICSEVS